MTATEAAQSAPGGPGVDPELAEYLAGLPAPVVGVDALIRDQQGRLLVVDPSYKPGWDLPGGMLGDEELAVGLRRELEEELQLGAVRVGRLLAVDCLPQSVYGRSLLACIYSVHPARPVRAEDLVLQREEIAAAEFVPDAEALARFPERLRRRVAAALEAERGAHTAHLRDGHAVPVDLRDHEALLPAPLSTVTVLVTDRQGRILLIEPPQGADGTSLCGLPGGLLTADETLRQGAARTLAEDLGLGDVPVGRLLAADSVPARNGGRARTVQVFGVGPLDDDQAAGLQPATGSARSLRWLAPQVALQRLPARARRRLVVGLQATAAGSIADLEAGVPHIGSPVGLDPRGAGGPRGGGPVGAAFGLARHQARTSVSALITDGAGRVLIAEPTSRGDGWWVLPGGTVLSDAGETPREAAVREVASALGRQVRIGRLLATDWGRRSPYLADVGLIYDGGVLSEREIGEIRLPDGELSRWRFADPEELDGLLPELLVARVQACLAARSAGADGIELAGGRPVAESVVAIVYHPVSGELLLHERDEHAHCWPEYWSLLGGRLERGEWPTETLQRELLEEAGLRIGDHPQVVERIWDRQGTTPQLITVFAIPYGGSVEDLVLGEGRQLRFVAPSDLDAYRMPPYLRAVVDRWLAAQDGADASLKQAR